MRSRPNRHSPCGTGAESGRRRASMNPATILPGMGRQPHCDAPRIAAHASAGLKSDAADVQPVDRQVSRRFPGTLEFRGAKVAVNGPTEGFAP